MGDLIKQMEKKLNRPFDRFIALSDYVQFLKKAIADLTPFFEAFPRCLYSKHLCNVLRASVSGFTGHESVDTKTRGTLYVRTVLLFHPSCTHLNTEAP